MEEVSEGVVDLLVRSGELYQVVDWKSDHVGEATWAERLPQYEAQVARYTEMLRGLGVELEEGRIERLTA
jgi:ATP-dependent exoDNAse (exonuclease V) beta subunit